ncbi:hypothetical protein VTO73DRAFT_10884 [Trametes versicolor]
MVAPRARLPTHPRFACGGVADIRGCHGSQMRLGLHGDISGLGTIAVTGPRDVRHEPPAAAAASRIPDVRTSTSRPSHLPRVRTCPVFAVD